MGTKPERSRKKDERRFDWAWAEFFCDSWILFSSFSFFVFSSPPFSLSPLVCDFSSGTTVHTTITEMLGEVIPLKDREEWDAAFWGVGEGRQGRLPSH